MDKAFDTHARVRPINVTSHPDDVKHDGTEPYYATVCPTEFHGIPSSCAIGRIKKLKPLLRKRTQKRKNKIEHSGI